MGQEVTGFCRAWIKDDPSMESSVMEHQQPSSSSFSDEATSQVFLLRVRRHQGGISLAWTPIRWQCPAGTVPVPCPALPCPNHPRKR